MKYVIFLAIAWLQSFGSTFQKDISKELQASQKIYSGETIADLLLGVITTEECPIKIEKFTDGTGIFSITLPNKQYFGYANHVSEDDPQYSEYDCLITPNKKQLKCSRDLPWDEQSQSYTDYISTTMDLDENGNITAMKGKKIRKTNILGSEIDIWPLSKTLVEFDCKVNPPIDHPPKVSDQDRKPKEDLNNTETSDEKSMSVKQ